jgi:cell division septum initiation protein DivIVA
MSDDLLEQVIADRDRRIDEIERLRTENEKLEGRVERVRGYNDGLRERREDIYRILRASVPEDLREVTSPVGCVQNYIVKLEARVEELEEMN